MREIDINQLDSNPVTPETPAARKLPIQNMREFVLTPIEKVQTLTDTDTLIRDVTPALDWMIRTHGEPIDQLPGTEEIEPQTFVFGTKAIDGTLSCYTNGKRIHITNMGQGVSRNGGVVDIENYNVDIPVGIPLHPEEEIENTSHQAVASRLEGYDTMVYDIAQKPTDSTVQQAFMTVAKLAVIELGAGIAQFS